MSNHVGRAQNGRFISRKSEIKRQKQKESVKEVYKHGKTSEAIVSPAGLDEQNIDREDIISWDDGRRIVELKVMAENLEACYDCGETLSLSRTVKETRYGFGSLLYVECICGMLNSVYTGKTHRLKEKKGIPIYDVNSKVAAAMLHTGMGETHVNTFMSALNVPTIHHKSLKEREREAGVNIEKVAALSTGEAVTSEIEMNKSSILTAGYDMGWQRRSSGRSYNSKSGHGCLIGKESDKILAYGTRITNCRVCDNADQEKKEVRKHDCRQNWSGSSKAMEADLAVHLLTASSSEQIHVGTIVMDNDSTTMAHIKKTTTREINKISDINHTKKGLGNILYKMKENYKELTPKVITYLQRCFSKAIAQNKNNPQLVKEGLLNIPQHAFGNHENCSSWCKGRSDKYKHKSLPYGRALQNNELKIALCGIFEAFAANSEKLAPYGNTQSNESFNNTVASKAPKARYYSGSESLDYRVSAAVSQKNLGSQYITELLMQKLYKYLQSVHMEIHSTCTSSHFSNWLKGQ